jgi:P-type Ca2+ transporter type 2C
VATRSAQRAEQAAPTRSPRGPTPHEDWSTVVIDDLAKRLESDTTLGLTTQEATRRLQQDGPNELRTTPPVATWRKVLAQFHDPLIYLLLGAVAVSLVAWAVEGSDGVPIDAVVIAAVVLLNAVLGYAQQAKAEHAVAALQQLTEVTSSVVRSGELVRVPSVDLVRGDLLVLGEGDAVGADGRLVHAAALRVQESSLTGESEAVLKDVLTLEGPAALGDQLGTVFKGTAVAQGTGRALITTTGMHTEMGAIATLLEATTDDPTPMQREISRIGRMLGLAVIIIAVVVVITVFLISDVQTVRDAVTVLLLGVSLAVAAVPEGLPAILSVVLALGVQRMATHHAIVKNLSSVETLGSASIIASDKTGTLTRSEMTIQKVATASGITSVSGAGYAPVGSLRHDDTPPSGAKLAEDLVVLSGGSLANDATLTERDGSWEIQGDPTEAAFLVAERKLGAEQRRRRRFERVGEVPFTSERKLMSTIEIDREHDGERILVTKGAPDVLLGLCTRVRVGLEVVPLCEELQAQIARDVAALADEALRTLSVAYRPLPQGEDLTAPSASAEHDLIFVGTVGIIDPARPEAAVAVADAQRAGIRVLMITGDHPRTAVRIASELGIVAAGATALTGLELDRLDPTGFAEAVRATSVYARVAPRHKLQIVDALRADGDVVAMTGDGVNDAPALKSADIGVAMGRTGTEVTKEAAKMILADDNFATIVDAVREGRGIFDNIQKFLRYLLSSNMGEVLTVFLGVVLAGVLGLSGDGEAVVLPLLATQILWINLITDSAPALAMGVDPETEDVMARPPRRPDQRVIDARMWTGVVTIGAVMAAATLLSIDLYLPGGLVAGHHDLANARSVGFTVLVLAQLFNCFNARSETTSAFRHLFVNPWLWGALAASALLQVAVVQVAFLNTAFGTEPLDWDQWVAAAAMASSVLWAGELRKLVLRHRDRRQLHPGVPIPTREARA